MMIDRLFACCALAMVLALTACDPVYTPRPRAYPRVILPEKTYVDHAPDDCPYRFEIPTYAEVVRDSFFFGDTIINDCWVNVRMPRLNGTIYLSYKAIGTDITLAEVIEDAHRMTYEHTEKADYIDEVMIDNGVGVEGLMYDVGGDAASSVQFFLTDDSLHYLRGALYFEARANADSLAPVIDFVKQDVHHLIETFRWSEL